MKIERSELKDLQSVVKLTLEPADYKEQVEKELKELRRKVQMPGFRPGMVPAGLVKKMYGKGVLAETLNKVIGEQLSKYIEDEKLQILGDPLPNDEQTPDMDLDNQDTFTFAFDIAVAPEFDAMLTAKDKLKQYKVTVTDELVEKQVKAYCERFGEYVEDKKPAKKAGKKAEAAAEEKADDKAEAKADDKPKGHIVPAKLDAELFAKVYGADAPKDAKGFRAKVREDIENSMAEEAKYKFGLDAKEAILKKVAKMELPEEFLKRWVKATNKDMKEEDLERDFPKMLDELKWHLSKDQLMKHFDIKIEHEDVKAFARNVAKLQFMNYGLVHVEDQYLDNFADEMLKNEDQLRSMIERVAETKIYDAIKGVAKIEEKEISYDDFGKLFK
jgi:trigger factor